MNISQRGLEFIAKWEGQRNSAYDDGGPGIGNCTIGVGHVIAFRPCTPEELATTLTDAQVLALLRADVMRYEAVVDSYARVRLNQNQYDALVDFCFNTGGGYLQLWNAVNNGGDVGAVLVQTAILPAWATPALKRRRQAEADLYNEPVVEDDDMKPYVAWVIGWGVFFIGPGGARYVPKQQTVDELAALYQISPQPSVGMSPDAARALGGQ